MRCKSECEPCAGVRVGDKDYNIGGERCAELAFLVHYHLTTSKAIQTQLEKRERYEWTNSPEVSSTINEPNQ